MPGATQPDLLDPKNDFVFKKFFTDHPNLLADLINAVRHDEAPVEVLEILNPRIDPEDLAGKFIILDVLARDATGHLFNIEMQVRSQPAWVERSLYYVANTYASQLKGGDDYATLKPVIGINLLDFDLFGDDKAHWHFRLLDPERPVVILTTLQLHVLELRKLDRQRETLSGALADWVTWFKHWREDDIMSEIQHPPVREALDQLRHLSEDDDARWRARTRERALHDEASFLAAARREGHAEGRAAGQAAVLARLLTLKFGELPDETHRWLAGADQAALDTWAERVLFASSLEEVFR